MGMDLPYRVRVRMIALVRSMPAGRIPSIHRGRRVLESRILGNISTSDMHSSQG